MIRKKLRHFWELPNELLNRIYEGAHSEMVITVGNGHDRVQNLDQADCISHSTNTLGKSMNPTILYPDMGK